MRQASLSHAVMVLGFRVLATHWVTGHGWSGRAPEQPAELAQAQHGLPVHGGHAGLGRDLSAAAAARRGATEADNAPVHRLARAQHLAHQLRLGYLRARAGRSICAGYLKASPSAV